VREEDLPYIAQGQALLISIREVHPPIMFQCNMCFTYPVEKRALEEVCAADQWVSRLENPPKLAGRRVEHSGLEHFKFWEGRGREPEMGPPQGGEEDSVKQVPCDRLIRPVVGYLAARKPPLYLMEVMPKLGRVAVHVQGDQKILG